MEYRRSKTELCKQQKQAVANNNQLGGNLAELPKSVSLGASGTARSLRSVRNETEAEQPQAGNLPQDALRQKPDEEVRTASQNKSVSAQIASPSLSFTPTSNNIIDEILQLGASHNEQAAEFFFVKNEQENAEEIRQMQQEKDSGVFEYIKLKKGELHKVGHKIHGTAESIKEYFQSNPKIDAGTKFVVFIDNHFWNMFNDAVIKHVTFLQNEGRKKQTLLRSNGVGRQQSVSRETKAKRSAEDTRTVVDSSGRRIPLSKELEKSEQKEQNTEVQKKAKRKREFNHKVEASAQIERAELEKLKIKDAIKQQNIRRSKQ